MFKLYVLVRNIQSNLEVINGVGNFNDTVFRTIYEARIALRWAKEELKEVDVRLGKVHIYKINKS